MLQRIRKISERIKRSLLASPKTSKQAANQGSLWGMLDLEASPASEKKESRFSSKRPLEASAELEKYLSLDERFQICSDAKRVQNSYSSLTAKLLDELKQNIPANLALWSYERGDLDDQLRYLYIKPHNKTGFLIEETPSGWLICYADKISARSNFVRKGVPLEIAHYCQELVGRMSPRVLSLSLFSADYVPISLYEEKLKTFFLNAISV
ncbi:MAG: hypothetical protein KBD78_07620 [Oligoflexales bacterium]|nr:hypothetical protein [Oligoflexales bacterium]